MPDSKAAERLPLTPVVVAFASAIALSAALLFSVEPMIARMLLPRFGGSAAVWSVALVFFQAALLVGYLYAHASIRYLTVRQSALLQIGFLLAGLAVLPLSVGAARATDAPSLDVLIALALSVGWPFVILSANAPLLQGWFARSGMAGASNPYPLYAASNVGSLLALLAYPFVIEPFSRLSQQTSGWSIGYGLLIGLIALAAFKVSAARAERAERILWPDLPTFAGWAGLALVPSAALVSVTAHISTNIASAPFLWVIPLALYLLTFIISFADTSLRWIRPMRWALLVMLLLTAASIARPVLPTSLDTLLHLATFMLVALVFHGTLARLRPPAAQLTAFYIALSLGGLIGGVLAALVAPAIFSFIAEYPIVLVVAGLLSPWRQWGVLLIALVLLTPALLGASADVQTFRSFYGVHRIETADNGHIRILRHGQEIHGAQQIIGPDGVPLTGRPKPLTYYHEEGPIAEVIEAVRARRPAQPLEIGTIGLGTGSIACLADPPDRLTFFEIDPVVIDIATRGKLFTFLPACAPDARIIEGDARLTLAKETRKFDVLIIDAFSSDAIPTHLLTTEAISLYLSRLSENGVLAMHVSNNHLNFNDILTEAARKLGVEARVFDEDEDPAMPEFVYRPTVIAMARRSDDFGSLNRDDEWVAPTAAKATPWSDDYANILGAMLAKWREE